MMVSTIEENVFVTKDNRSEALKLRSSWKVTLVIVLLSLLLQYSIRQGNIFRSIFHTPELDYATDNEPILNLVSKTYADDQLFEWKPALAPISKPDEPGNLGSSVVVPEERKDEAKRRFSENEFNIVANEMMSLNRTLNDLRFPECLNKDYPKQLPKVSVIIVFHNEALSTLTRTIWSVITQSPRKLLKEIILIDDFSTYYFLNLFEHMKTMPIPVKMVSTSKRVGLIQARLLGARKATGSVMVFLDSHCECNQGWLEPLLTPIAENRQTITIPTVDIIDDETMAVYGARGNVRGGFELDLSFNWEDIPREQLEATNNDRTAPYMMPAMPGGLFAIDREYFSELGAFDDKMTIWGGENLELSIRTWTCGGRILSIPCSRVGHIFRKAHPYSFTSSADKIMAFNTARLVDVWLDEYKHIYYALNSHAISERSDVIERKVLRKKLRCKSFRWYIMNVYPESQYNMENFVFASIESAADADSCLDTLGARHGSIVNIADCHNLGANQMFMLTKDFEIKEKDYCLDATIAGAPVTIYDCHGEMGNQKWIYDEETSELRHNNGRNCLTIQGDSDVVTIEECNGSIEQKWFLRLNSPNGF